MRGATSTFGALTGDSESATADSGRGGLPEGYESWRETDRPCIAIRDDRTLDHWFRVTVWVHAAGRVVEHTATLLHCDWGPGVMFRAIDITGPGDRLLGLPTSGYPTEAYGVAREMSGPPPSVLPHRHPHRHGTRHRRARHRRARPRHGARHRHARRRGDGHHRRGQARRAGRPRRAASRTTISAFDLCVANRENGSPGSTAYGTVKWFAVNGYYGAYSFLHSTWAAAGGLRYAYNASDATPEQQTIVFESYSRIDPGAWRKTIPPCLYLR